jgi:short-chain fatty acids transporter
MATHDLDTGRSESPLARAGLRLAAWSERWFPDAWVVALAGIVLVFAFGLLVGESPAALARAGGRAFWLLVPFTMQMALVIISGYAVATAPAVAWGIGKAARLTANPRVAIAEIALFSTLTSLISWGLSLVASGLLVREMSRTVRGMDFRAAAAAAYLGLGAVWALGLSSSAALLMATRDAIPPRLYEIGGLIPMTQTLFTWPNAWTVAALVGLSVAIAYASAPSPGRARTAEEYGLAFEPLDTRLAARQRPGDWLEHSPALILLVGGMLAWHLVDALGRDPRGAVAALDLNNYNLIFLTLGMLLQWRPKRFLAAVAGAAPAAGGVLVQFPFYAVIFGMVVDTGINGWLAERFVALTTKETYALLVAAYSAALGLFIPSGGSKWVIEAPYVLQAALQHGVNLGWVVQIYNAAEALPNLVNPFWMLPLLGLLRLQARDLVGYAALQMFFHVPVVFFLCWYFALALPSSLPIR